MKRGSRGVWRVCVPGNLKGTAYTYHVRVNGEWRETIDPYAFCGGANSTVSAICDLESIRFKQYPLPAMRSACDAVIYEASVRDFTSQPGIGWSILRHFADL